MQHDQFITRQFNLIQKERCNICVTVIVPTHQLSPERRVDGLEVEKAIRRAKEYLSNSYSEKEISPLLSSLDELYSSIDFNHNAMGIGLFVSAEVRQLVNFLFPVKEKIVISDSFHLRDILYQDNYTIPYFALHLSENEVKLYQGSLTSLLEIKDNIFPMKNEDQYEYSHPTRGSSYFGNSFTKEFEKDKSILQEMRYESFLSHVDRELNRYLVNAVPLVIIGATKDLSYFKIKSHHANHIAGHVHGNYSYDSVNELGRLTWKTVKDFLDHAKEKTIRELQEKIGQGHGVAGIDAVWKAAYEGRGLRLLVEKDFSLPGFFTSGDDYHLHLHPPQQPHHIVTDVINKLVDLVLDKKGDVIVVENGLLDDYQKIGLITRY